MVSERLYIVITIVLLAGLPMYAQRQRTALSSGNKAYFSGDYSAAERAYRNALKTSGLQKRTALFALANALYEQKKYEKAAKTYEELLSDDSLASWEKAEVLHNLGNIFMQGKDYAKAVETYKQSLIHNPKDDDTRYNLVLAQKQLKKEDNDKEPQENSDNKDNSQPSQWDTKGQEGLDEKSTSKSPQNNTELSRDQAEQLLDQYKQRDEATRRRVEQVERHQAEKGQNQMKKRW